jgi:hypothetical protein
MRPIDRFILHVVHNLLPLNEYSEGEVKRLIAYFKDEADDLNIDISEDQLKSYIEEFERIKQKLSDKEIRHYSLSKIIKLTTASRGISNKTEKITPDVVYHNDDDSIIIYNGSLEDNCVRFGSGEKWCITRGAYTNYRYSRDRGFPTFYLAKNINIPDSDPLSFVAIQVRDPRTTNENNRYVYTNRRNSPYESQPMSFSKLLSEVPWLQNIPNLQNILEYIPLSTQEKLTQDYRNNPVSINVWEKFPYEVKEQYLTVRAASKVLFSDISTDTFLQKYIPKYPQIATYIAVTPNLIEPIKLLSNLESFNNQNRKSITANIQTLIDTDYLKTEDFPFGVKKLLVKLDKFDTSTDEKLFISKDGSTIVNIHFTSPVKLDLYQEDDYYTDVKLNKRTVQYLKELDLNDISQIPFNVIMDLSSDGVFGNEIVNSVVQNAKTNENSPIIVREKEGTEILLDSNTFSSYKIENGKISQIPFENEKVQEIFNEEVNNENFQKNIIKLFQEIFINRGRKGTDKLNVIANKDILINAIKSIPYNKRIVLSHNDVNNIMLTTPGEIFLLPSSARSLSPGTEAFSINLIGNINYFETRPNVEQLRSYFKYLRSINFSFGDDDLRNFMRSGFRVSADFKKVFIEANPPLNPDNTLVPYLKDGSATLINIRNPDNSYKVSNTTSRLLDFRAPAALARQLSNVPGRQPQIALARRGRPPRGQEAAPQAAAVAPQGNITMTTEMQTQGLLAGYESLPTDIKRRIATGTGGTVARNRGAARRQNLLINRGRIYRTIDSGPSAIYFIRLASGAIIASIVIQPGNQHFIVTADSSFRLDTPSNLVTALQARNLSESLKGTITSIYLSENPYQLTEVKTILEHYINIKHPNQATMKPSELKNIISLIVSEVLAENKEAKLKLKKESKGTDLAKKIAQRYNTLTENKSK